jgi:PAS domain S-box-containing protein
MQIIGTDRKSTMNGTHSLSHASGRNFKHRERGILSRPSSILLGVVGFDGKLKSPNSAWAILGYPPQEMLDRPLCEFMHHERPVAAALVDRFLAQDDVEPVEFGLRCKDGSCRWFLWHRRFDPEHRVTFIAGHDITERKSREIASILRSYGRSKGGDAVL